MEISTSYSSRLNCYKARTEPLKNPRTVSAASSLTLAAGKRLLIIAAQFTFRTNEPFRASRPRPKGGLAGCPRLSGQFVRVVQGAFGDRPVGHDHLASLALVGPALRAGRLELAAADGIALRQHIAAQRHAHDQPRGRCPCRRTSCGSSRPQARQRFPAALHRPSARSRQGNSQQSAALAGRQERAECNAQWWVSLNMKPLR